MDKEQLLTLSRPNKTCMNCDAALDDGGRHASVVRSAERQIERFDYCPACWDHLKQEAFDSFWMARRTARPPRALKLNRRQRSTALRALFESLGERAETEDVGAHLFLISHLLMKWGGLKWRESATGPDGAETVLFEDAASGETFAVPAVEIADENLLRIKDEIEQFLRRHAADDGDEPVEL